MSKFFTALRQGWPYLLFLALILFSLRDVLLLPGTLGHSWDWDISAYPDQIWGRLTRDFFAWDYGLRGGYYSPFRTAGLVSLFALPLSLLGGVFYSRAFIVIPMFLSAICMRRFASEVLNLNAWWSVIAGILYMLSPVVFSRILAGHSLLLAYALFPLLYVYLQRTVEKCAEKQFPLRDAIAAGLLLGIEATHSSMIVLAFVVMGLVLFFALVRSSKRIRIVIASAIMFAIFALLNTYWALPVGIGYASSGTLFHSGSALHNPDQVTSSSVVAMRQNLFTQTMQPLSESLRMDSFQGYGTEFIYPVPGILATPWLIISYLLPIAAFAVLLGQREQTETVRILAIAGLAGATLVSGATTPLGAFVAQWLMLHAFPVWAEFGNTVRAMPLLTFALCALVPTTLQRLSGRFRSTKLVAAAAAIAVGIYVSPFLASSPMVDSKITQALKSYVPSVQDQQVYETLKKDKDDFRITYVPPPWMYYPELYDLGYEWIGGVSPHPEFFVPYVNPDAWRVASSFQAGVYESLSGKLLGLAAVKYLVYPRTRFINPTLGLYPQPDKQPKVSTGRAVLIDQILETQKNLTPVAVPFTSTLLLRNDSYLPRIYAASQASLIQGDSDQLAAIANSSFFAEQPALFFESQQEPAENERLVSQVDRLVQTQPLAPSNSEANLRTTHDYFLSFSPLGDSAGTCTLLRQETMSLRVQAARFQLVPPLPNDTSNAKFAPIQADPHVAVTGNLLYDESLNQDTNSLQVTAYLRSAWSSDEFIEIDQPIEPFDLVDYPNLRIGSQVDNPSIQALAVQLQLDVEGAEGSDVTWTSPLFNHGKFKTDEMNTLGAVRNDFPGKERYRVVSVGLRLQRNPQQQWDKAVYPAGLYSFGIQELGLYNRASQGGWVWHPPADVTTEGARTLTRTLGTLDAGRFPIELEYQSDGPAKLYVDARVIAHNPKGNEKSMRVLAQIVEPFSKGIFTLDARDQLATLNSEDRWTADRVELVVHRLGNSRELRPTTLSLLRMGGRWVPGDGGNRKPEPPVLTVDGKPVALKEIPADDEHLAYSATLDLLAGEHTVSSSFEAPNSAFSVESVEITPAFQSKTIRAPTLSFESINPTRWRVHVADAQSPYFLVFSETFHPGWRAYITPPTNQLSAVVEPQRWYEQSSVLSALLDGSKAQVEDHFLVNGFANSWFVQQAGTYDIVIEFAPQRMYEAGWIVSFLTLVGSALALVLTSLRSGKAVTDALIGAAAGNKRAQEKIESGSDVLVLFNGLLGISGGDRHLLDMARLWGEQTHDQTQAALPRLAEHVLSKDDLNRMRVRFIWSPFERHSVSSTLAVSAAYGWRIINCSLARFSLAPKVVIASGHLPFDVIPALILCRRYSARSVVYVFHLIQKQSRKPGLRYAIAKLAEDLALYLIRSFDLVITDNKVVRDQLVDVGIRADKIRVTPLGIPLDMIQQARSSPVEFEAVFFGRLVWYKGIYDVVDAWERVVSKLPKSRLLIIGDGPERSSLEQRIKERGLADSIELAGFVYPPRSYELLKKCRLGLFPSHEEGWGISLCEAMACGLPVVAYDLPAYRSVYKRGLVTAPLGDSAGLAAQTIRLLTNAESFRDLAAAAMQQASEYDVRIVAQTQWTWLTELTGST